MIYKGFYFLLEKSIYVIYILWIENWILRVKTYQSLFFKIDFIRRKTDFTSLKMKFLSKKVYYVSKESCILYISNVKKTGWSIIPYRN